MPFVCHTPGGDVALNSLTLDQLEAIEEQAGSPWVLWINAPRFPARTTRAVYEQCCKVTGSTPEPVTAQQVLDGTLFTEVPDDMPDFEDTRETEAPDPEAGSLTVDPKAPTPGTDGSPTS